MIIRENNIAFILIDTWLITLLVLNKVLYTNDIVIMLKWMILEFNTQMVCTIALLILLQMLLSSAMAFEKRLE